MTVHTCRHPVLYMSNCDACTLHILTADSFEVSSIGVGTEGVGPSSVDEGSPFQEEEEEEMDYREHSEVMRTMLDQMRWLILAGKLFHYQQIFPLVIRCQLSGLGSNILLLRRVE